MTPSRLGRVGVPEATELPLAQPVVVARSRSPALALRLGLAGVAVASAVVGWVLFGDTDPDSVVGRLLAGAGTHVGGNRLLNRRRRTTGISQGALARRRFVDLRTAGRACPVVCGALVGHDADEQGFLVGNPLLLANGIATDLFLGLSLTVLPQLYPDGPLPGRLWKVLLGVSAGLVVIATLKIRSTTSRPCDDLARVVFLVDRRRPQLS